METSKYSIQLTLEEIAIVEEALYDKSSLLSAIGTQLVYKNKRDESARLDKRSRILEDLARKIAQPLDTEYIKNYGNLGKDGE